MSELSDILANVPVHSMRGDRNVAITGVSSDTRQLRPGNVFVAVKGESADGNEYMDKAIHLGAIAVVSERRPPDHFPAGLTFIQTPCAGQALGIMASNYYGNPSRKLKLIGVTGTNGKTTVATLLHDLQTRRGYSAGLFSTIETRIGSEVRESTNTTPDPVTLQSHLKEMVSKGCSHAFMEVTSHALDQHRVCGTHFEGAIFTNISHDHLDYHLDMTSYIDAKKKFFDMLAPSSYALVNADEKHGSYMVQNTKARVSTYGLKSHADVKGKVMQTSLEGMQMTIADLDVWFHLSGVFNAYNLLAVFAASQNDGAEPGEILEVLSKLTGAKGRFEKITVPGSGIVAIVDYAHNPEALNQLLRTVVQLKKKGSKMLCIVGCGGDRDTEKRPRMRSVATRFSDRTILTSDNPRNEDPQSILDDMMEGATAQERKKCTMLVDRREAIRHACSLAEKDDVIVVAGRGHEKWQIIGNRSIPFDDSREVEMALKNR